MKDDVKGDATGDLQQMRRRVLVALAVIGRPEMLGAASDLTREQIGFELCRLWFEDVYTPALWTVDGLKGDRHLSRVDRFWEAFDEDERAYLERFNRFIELRLEMTAEELRRQRAIDPDRWDGVSRDARNTLELIEPNFDAGTMRIGQILELPELFYPPQREPK
ncbi:MAG: hypothetical protein KJO98_14185 [Rhodothermia bacterium]|nr:hypothetical protein [Rhodothermia bacterium]